MTAPNWPPSDISPKQFFESWLPDEVARIRALAPNAPAPEMTANITVAGDGGGTWTLAGKDGLIAVTEGAADSAHLALEIALDDWRAIIDPEGGMVPADAGGANLLAAGPVANSMAGQAKATKGHLVFQVPNYRGRTWQASLSLGGADAPSATVIVDYGIYTQLLEGKLQAAQAYFSGQIKMEGDSAFALQLGMAMMAAGAGA